MRYVCSWTLLALNTIYSFVINNDLQRGPAALEWTVPYVNPLAVRLTRAWDLGGGEYFGALLIVGGVQALVIGLCADAVLRRTVRR